MLERYTMIDEQHSFETEVVHTLDGTFTRNRFRHYVDSETGLPVLGRWSPWYSELITHGPSGEITEHLVAKD